MTEREKALLKHKYGHSKFLLAVHCLGKYIKDIYHPSDSSKKIVVCGANNRVPYVPEGCGVRIFGKNNILEIDPSVKSWNGDINIGNFDYLVDGCYIRIGKKCSSNGTNIVLGDNGSSVIIGDECMFSWGINIWASDTHSVFLQGTGEMINWGKEVFIGNHVWLGMHSTVLKNSYITDNSIVGAYGVVAKQFKEPGCVLAGNPAKVVKRGITWSPERPNDFKHKAP